MLESIISSQLTLSAFLICTFTSIVLGVGIALVGMYRSRSSQSYAVALAILPVVVQLVIMLVNGNVGAGVAVAGAFSLVRFRSVPGTAREIGVLFMAMAVGLATGMGYVGLAVISFVIISAVIMALTALNFGKGKAEERTLKITIPENLDYEGLFDDVFAEYTRSNSLVKVKTSNMGTLYAAYTYLQHISVFYIGKDMLSYAFFPGSRRLALIWPDRVVTVTQRGDTTQMNLCMHAGHPLLPWIDL